MCVIWEKISTLCPSALRRVSRRSINLNFPHCSISSSPDGYSVWPSSWAVIRSGWLQFLRSCMSTLLSCGTLLTGPPSFFFLRSVPMLFSTSARPKACCCLVICAYRITSFLRGRLVSTSALIRRNRKGRRMECSLDTASRRRSASTSVWDCSEVPATSEKSNQLWNWPRLLKTSGRIKCSSDHSSLRLFCSGVPDSSSLLAVGMLRSSRISMQLLFFSRWPSSTT
mmetsp:Transcript_39258/g.65948  ORF Transcript_39258/g.65948 Transcript_39258/m.65948 type:complete len:226 (-) Transcript_39258:17-694(-)